MSLNSRLPAARKITLPALLLSLLAVFAAGCGEEPAAPEAKVDARVTSGQAPLTVDLTNLSTGADRFLWEFGDGGTQTTLAPSEPVRHTYTTAGTYTVTLTAILGEDAPQTSSVDLSVTVRAGPLSKLVTDTLEVSLAPGETYQFSVTPLDEFDNDRGFVAGTVAGVYEKGLFVEVTQGPVSSTKAVTVTINRGPLDQVTIQPAAVTLTVTRAKQFTAQAFDEFGNPVEDVAFVFRTDRAAGDVNSNGRFIAGTKPGTYDKGVTVEVTQGENTRSASATVTIDHGAPHRLAIDPEDTILEATGQALFTATVVDLFGNLITDLSVSFEADAQVGQVDAEGNFIAGTAVGFYPGGVVVSLAGGSVVLTAGADVTVTPGPLDRLSMEPSSASVEAGQEQQFIVASFDQFNNPIPDLTVAFRTDGIAGRIDNTGTFTAGGQAGVYRDAVTGEVSQGFVSRRVSADVSVLRGPLASIVVVPTLATVVAGGRVRFVPAALDEFDNSIPGLDYSFQADELVGEVDADGNFTAGGTTGVHEAAITIVATEGEATQMTTASIVIEPGALDHVTIEPTVATVEAAKELVFTATAFDRFGNPIHEGVTYRFRSAVEAGRVDSQGILDAGTDAKLHERAVTVVATQGSVTDTASADVTVIHGPLAAVRLAPEAGDIAVTQSLTFSAATVDLYGNPVPEAVIVWSAEQDLGTITSEGVLTAGTRAGSYEDSVTAMATLDGVTAQAAASVTVSPGALDKLSIASLSGVPAGATHQLSAVVTDSFGNELVDAEVIWEVLDEDAGSITPGGLLTTGPATGSYPESIRASLTVGEVTRFATVTLFIEVKPGVLDKLTITSPGPIVAGAAEQLSTVARDPFGDRISDAEVVWEMLDENAGKITTDGLLTAGQVAGTYNSAVVAQATQSGVTRTATTTVTVVSGPLAQVVIAPAPARVGIGMTQQFVAVGADRYGNHISGLEYIWSVEQSGGTIDGEGLFTALTTPITYNDAVHVSVTDGHIVSSATAVIVEPDRIVFRSDRGNRVELYVRGLSMVYDYVSS